MKTDAKYIVEGMTCSSCVGAVKTLLESQDGISNVRVDLTTNLVVLDTGDNSADVRTLNAILNSKGYAIRELEKKAEQQQEQSEAKTGWHLDQKIKHALMILALVPIIYEHYLSPHHAGPDLVEWLSTIVILLLSIDLLGKGLKRLFSKHQSMESLIVLSSFAAIVYSVISSIWPEVLITHHLLPTSYLDGPTIAIVFVSIGKWIESGAIAQTGAALKGLDNALPTIAIKKTTDGLIEVSTDVLVKGDIIIVKAGSHIPADGLVISGTSSVNMQAISGESLPVPITRGDQVYAGGINNEGVLEVEVRAKQDQTMLGQMINTLLETRMQKAAPQQVADRIARWFVPLVIVTATVAAFVWITLGYAVTQGAISLQLLNSMDEANAMAIGTFIGVLVVACPCALGLATPLVVVKSVGVAAKTGILVKDLSLLTEASKVTDIVFDKTGTLTIGHPSVTAFELSSNLTELEIKSICYGISQNDNHPFVQGLGRWAKGENSALNVATIHNVTLVPGKGLIASSVNNTDHIARQIVLGSTALIKEQGLLIGPRFTKFIANNQYHSVIVLGLDGAVVACFELQDIVKPDALNLLQSLKQNGINTHILSGDKQVVVDRLASELGLNSSDFIIRGDQSPQQKYEVITELKEQGVKLMMVGDGINDSLAMQTADCSIAIGQGSDIAKQTASGVLLNKNLGSLLSLQILSKQYNQRIKENLWWAFGYNITMLPMAAGAVSTLIGIDAGHGWAGIAMAMSSLTVVFNAQRIGLKN